MKTILHILKFAVLGIALTLASTAAMAMPGETQSPDNPVALKSGRDAAARYCSRCHAVVPGKKSPNTKAPTFHSIAKKHRKHEMVGLDIYDGTVYRHPGMPQFELQTFEADGLIAYLRWLARKN